MGVNPGRNAPCPCGSGKKYKKCCGKLESDPLTLSLQQKANTASLNTPMKAATTVQDECPACRFV